MPVQAGVLIPEIRYELKDLDVVNPNYKNAELLVYLSDAVEDLTQEIVAKWPRYWLRSSYTQLQQYNVVSGTANYNLPADFYLAVLVTFTGSTGTTEVVDEITFERTLETAAEGYFLRNDDIYLYPTPTANIANGLKLYYVPILARITVTTDNVPFADTFRGFIKEWVVMKCKFRQEEQAGAFQQLYMKLNAQITAMMTRTNMGTYTGWSVPRRWWV